MVTAALRAALPADAKLVATDLNEKMLDFAKKKLGPDARVEWSVADASALPFDGKMFDAVVCQFGFMFVPDKAAALKEAQRVLRPGGRLLFNVWDGLEANGLTKVAHETIVAFSAPDPIHFFETPFGFYDVGLIRAILGEAGFNEVKITPVEFDCVSPSAADAATGLVQGTPVVVAMKERDPAQIPTLTALVADALAAKYGAQPCRDKMRALVCEAVR
jgi:ubiquinone/menaquinone biosynthesis C-methylase UbiE